MKFVLGKLFGLFLFVLIISTMVNNTYYRQFHETTADTIVAVIIGALTWTAILSVVYIPYSLIKYFSKKNKISKPTIDEEKEILLKISNELKSNDLDEALLVECKMKANGDINKAEAIYIKERKKILIDKISKEKIAKDEEEMNRKKRNSNNFFIILFILLGTGYIIYINLN